MTGTWFSDDDLRRVVEAQRRANARWDVERRLRHTGHLMTPKNRAILDILAETRGQHPTARDIFEELVKRHPSAKLPPIYVVLRALESVSLVQSRRFGRSPKYFDVRVGRHLDVLCTGCGAVEEFEVDTAAGAVPEARKGVCRACSAGVSSKGAA